MDGGKLFKCQRRTIDGNSRNEGNEGDEGDEGEEGDEGDEGNEGNEGNSSGQALMRQRLGLQRVNSDPFVSWELPDGRIVEQGPLIVVEYDEPYEFNGEHEVPPDYEQVHGGMDDAETVAGGNGTAVAPEAGDVANSRSGSQPETVNATAASSGDEADATTATMETAQTPARAPGQAVSRSDIMGDA